MNLGDSVDADAASEIEYVEEADLISEDRLSQPDDDLAAREPGSFVYNCNSCGMEFFSVEQHIRDYHQEEEVIVEMENDESEQEQNFYISESSNDGTELVEDMYSFKCRVCDTGLQSARSLKLHMKIHEPKEDPPALDNIEFDNHCHVCNRTFADEEHFRLHVLAHGNDRHSTLQWNNSAPSSLARRKPGYPCNYCGRCFKRPYEKVKHERIHTGERPYSCDVCGKRFRVAGCLTVHLRTHEDSRPFVCPHCKKRFKVQSAYNHHLKTHSSERAYQCPFCAKSFKTAVQLGAHKKTHTKPFACSVCSRPFGSLYSVRKHMLLHQSNDGGGGGQDKLSHVCDVCGATYGRAIALCDHRKEQHGLDVGGYEEERQPREDIGSNCSKFVVFEQEVETEQVVEDEMLF